MFSDPFEECELFNMIESFGELDPFSLDDDKFNGSDIDWIWFGIVSMGFDFGE